MEKQKRQKDGNIGKTEPLEKRNLGKMETGICVNTQSLENEALGQRPKSEYPHENETLENTIGFIRELPEIECS